MPQQFPGIAPLEAGIVLPIPVLLIPAGWLLCDGSAFDPVQYPELYAAIGTRYGGTAAAPLVPDLQGRFPRCVSASHALGSTQDWATRGTDGALITADGEHTHGKGTLAMSSLAAHYHLEPHREPNYGATFGAEAGAAVSHRYNAVGEAGYSYLLTETTGDHAHNVNLQDDGAHSHGISGGDNETAPPNYAMPFIISTGVR